MLLLCLSLLFFKPTQTPWSFSLITLAALPLCWRWGWSGLVVSLTAVAIWVTMTFQAAPLGELLWFSGFGVSLALALVTTLLSWEAAAETSPKLALLEGQLKAITQSLEETRSTNQQYNETIQAQQIENDALKNELQAIHIQQQTFVSELTEKNQEIGSLNGQLKESSQTIQSLKRDCEASKKEFRRLQDEQAAPLKELVALKLKVEQSEKALKDSQSTNQKMTQSIKTLEKEMESSKQELEVAKQDSIRLTTERDRFQDELTKAQQISKIPKNTRSIESMYIQLKTQFEEKSKTVDAARRELFEANERVLGLQREIEELRKYGGDETQAQLVQDLLDAQSASEDEIDRLNDLVSTLLVTSQ